MDVRDIVRRPAAKASFSGTRLRGETTHLRPVTEADLSLLVRWMNDPEVRHWLHQSERPDAAVDAAARVRFGLDRQGLPNLVWMIQTPEARPVGHVGLLQIDPHSLRAELAISIGETDAWNRGYGTDAIRAVLRHAFTALDLRRVDLHTDADNERGIRCYEKCGFVHEGVLRERRLRYGKPLDMVVMAVLKHEWEERSNEK